MKTITRAALAAVALFGVPGAVRAQTDYRNLDDDRPTRVEDAFPADRYAFEFLLPYTYARAKGGGYVHATVPEIEYGMLRNFQLGIKLPVADAGPTGGTGADVLAISGGRAFAL